MESRTRVIVGFLVLALIVWGIMLAVDYLLPHTTTQGHILHVTLAVVPAFAVYGIIIMRTTKKRLRAEEELRESQLRHISAEKVGQFGHFSRQLNGNKLIWSEGTYRLFGVDPNRWELTRDNVAKMIHPQDRKQWIKANEEAERGEKDYNVEFRIIRPDGEERSLHSVADVISNDDGKPERIFGTAIDITERKQLEEQLRHSQVLASLGEMTAGISHELNNPLSVILLHSELLSAGHLPVSVRGDLKVIHDEAKRAARIVSDLLTYSRGSTSRGRRTNLHRILSKAVEMRSYQERVQSINVTTDLHSGQLYVKGNAAQLIQVFINLLLNAEEALQKSRDGRISITSRIDGGWAMVSIADNGAGIPKDKLNQVFHPFYTTKEVGKGTGLGLSTCYGIISSHGGLIRAENNETGGATFIIELPLSNNNRVKGEVRNENRAS